MIPRSLGVLSLVLVLIGVARAGKNPYDLCGGNGYSGDKTCPSGYDCVAISYESSRCIKKGDYHTTVYTPPAVTTVYTPAAYTPPGSSEAYQPPSYTTVYSPPAYTTVVAPPVPYGYTSVYTPPAYTSVYTPPPYTPSGSSSIYTPPASTSVYTPSAYTTVYSPPSGYSSVYTPPAYTSVYTPLAYTPPGQPSAYTPPAYTSVYTPPAYTSVYVPPYTSVYTPPAYTSVYTPQPYTPPGSSSSVYTPPAYTSVYTPPAYTSVYTPPPPSVYTPPVYTSVYTPPAYTPPGSSPIYTPPAYTSVYSPPPVYYSSPPVYSSSSSSVYYSSSTPVYSSSSSSVYYSSSTPVYSSSSSSVYYSSSTSVYSSSSSSVYYSSSTPVYSSSSSSVYYSSSTPVYSSSSSSVYYSSSTPVYSSSSSVYTPPPYTQVYTPPAYTPPGYSSAYTPKPYTSIYTPKPYVPPCETITSVYTPPAHTSVYTPPPYTPPGYSSAYTPPPYTSVYSPKPYTSVYTPPVAYTSVYTPPAYTSVYTPPVYTPPGSSYAYTPPAYTSAYTPPVYTSVYSPPPYVPPGYTSIETPEPYTSVYTPPPYTPPGSSSIYTPPAYTSVYTPPAYTSVYSPPVYVSSPIYSSSPVYSSPTYTPISSVYSSPTYTPSYSSSSVYSSPTYTPSYSAPITTYASSSLYLPPVVSYTSTSAYTSVVYPTVTIPTYTSYIPPVVSTYLPDTQEPTYTAPNPYQTSTIVTTAIPPQATSGNYTPVVGAPGLELRQPIDELQSNNPDVWNMFLCGLEHWQESDESLDLSYYQICGIHGLPYIPWQAPLDLTTQDPTRGYCTHSSALFTTWHRAYLLLVEQTIYEHAQTVASKFTGPDAQKYQDAAKKVRLPYWDWSSTSTQSHLPASVTVDTISITKPDVNGSPTTTTIPNPLFSYTFKNQQYRDTYFDAGFFRDTDYTCRQPDANGVSRNSLSDQAMFNTYDSRRQNTYNLFSISTFGAFSSNSWSGGGTPNAWTSCENIHNDVHSFIGGSLGHMSYVEYAAFDPIFWLHHCNIDRLTAMYQAVWPNNEIVPQAASGTFARKVGPGDLDTINTPLYPFRHQDGSMWTSVEISHAQDIFTYGYGYPEVPPQYEGQSADQLQAFTAEKINEQYRPNLAQGTLTPAPSGGVVRQEWVAHIAYDQSEIYGAFGVYFFVGKVPEKVSDWSTSPELVGQCSTFGDQSSTMSHVVKGSVPLTQTLIDNNIGLGPDTAVPYLKANCNWVIKQGGYSLPLSSLKSLTVGISSAQVAYSDDYTQLPLWGQAKTHYDITNGTQGGLQYNQTYLVDSVPAPAVISNSTNSNSTITRRYAEFRA